MAEQRQITTEQLAELAALDGSANARLGTLGKGLVGMVSRLGKAAQDDVNAMGLGISDMQARLNAEGAEKIRAMRRKLMGMHKRLQGGPTKQLAEMQTGLAAIASKLPRESFPGTGEMGIPMGASRRPPAVGRPGGLPSPGLPGAHTLPPAVGLTGTAFTPPEPQLSGPNCPPCTTWIGLTDSHGNAYTGPWQSLPPNSPCPDGWRIAGLDCNGNSICTPFGASAFSTFQAATDPECGKPTSGPWYCVVDESDACPVTTTQDISAPLSPGYHYAGPFPDSYTASVSCAQSCGIAPPAIPPVIQPPPSIQPPPGIYPPPPPLLPPPVLIPPPPPGSDLCACVVYLADRLCACLRECLCPGRTDKPPDADDETPAWVEPPVPMDDFEELALDVYQVAESPADLQPFEVQPGAAVGGSTVGIQTFGD